MINLIINRSLFFFIVFAITLQKPNIPNSIQDKFNTEDDLIKDNDLPFPNGLLTNVFVAGEGGYKIHKIPYLLNTNNSILAFAEARMGTGQDWDPTTLVYKRSIDLGITWSPLQQLVSIPQHQNNFNYQQGAIVYGNAAPVKLSNGRILVPFCQNNLRVFVTHSDDDGLTWSNPIEISQNATQKAWKWVGLGPPSAIQLQSGRILVPSYHSFVPHDNGDLSELHMMLSDDFGVTWRISGFVTDWQNCPNEVQAVEFSNGDIFVNARSLWTHRIGAFSRDGGETFSEPFKLKHIQNPLTGCQGSTVIHKQTNTLFYSGPSDKSFLRYKMLLWISRDRGESWSPIMTIRSGSSSYSSLIFTSTGDLAILYEWSRKVTLEFMPDHISYQVLLTKKQINELIN